MGSMKAVSMARWSCGELFSSVHASWNGAKTKGSSSWSSTNPKYSFRTGTCDNGLKIRKETTHVIVRWTRVASMA